MTQQLDVGTPVPIGRARRTLDLGLTTFALLCGAPVLLLVALTVRATSRGPVIFRQVRVGAGGRPFTLYKFRTMRTDTVGPEITTARDDRVTRLGRLLRATSIDELPQLVNVLRGHMTLVGPRPETVALAVRYSGPDMVVFRYRPGLTGLAQVRHRDSQALPTNVDDVETVYLTRLVPMRVALDMEYLADPSMGRTLKVILETAAHLLGLDRRRRAIVAPSASQGLLP